MKFCNIFRGMKRYYFLIFILVLGVIAFLLYQKIFKRPYKFYPVQIRTVKKAVYASGYVKPLSYLILESQVSGYVKKIYVKEGDFVKKGDLLAEIDPSELPAKISEVEKRLQLVKERLEPDSDYLKSLRNEIEIARATYLLEEEKLKRRRELFKEGLISKEALDEAEKAFKTAEENYKRSKSIYEDTLKVLKTEKVSLLEQKRALTAELAKYYIRAPISGRILKKYVEVGDFVYPIFSESKLFSLGTSENEIVLEVDEEYAGLINEGQRVYLTFDSYPDKVFEGVLTQIIREIDRTKRSFIVKAKLKEDIFLPALTTAEANIIVEERKAKVIPLRALLKDDTVEVKGRGRVKIEVGERFEDYIEVLSGLKVGEEVKVFE